jgi:hypothetical protein
VAAERRDEEQGRDGGSPDVVLDVSRVAVEEVVMEVDTLHARIALDARLADLVQLHVGADTEVSNVSLELRGVDAEAHLRAHLDNVVTIFDRALRTVDEHPDVLVELAHTVAETTEAVAGNLTALGAGGNGGGGDAEASVRALTGGGEESAEEGGGEGEDDGERRASGGGGDDEQSGGAQRGRARARGGNGGGSARARGGNGGGSRSRSRGGGR